MIVCFGRLIGPWTESGPLYYEGDEGTLTCSFWSTSFVAPMVLPASLKCSKELDEGVLRRNIKYVENLWSRVES